MAARLRALTDRCIFCTFVFSKSTPILSRQFPGRVPGTSRFRSSKTKPPLVMLKQSRTRKDGVLSDMQICTIIQALFVKIRPPALEPGTTRFPHNTILPDYLSAVDLSPWKLVKRFREFENEILRTVSPSPFDFGVRSMFTSRQTIRDAVTSRGGLGQWLKDQFLAYAEVNSLPDIPKTALLSVADLRFPQEWYPVTRQYQRTWYLHVGPTNSGKTYNALKRLMESGSGIYAGPLRLLAHEVFERMNAQGIFCNLVTGDERRIVNETAGIFACTVEMVDLHRRVEVAVLDEIQMIGDEERGWAWTQALLGVKAQEVHLCGEERTVELIQNLAAATGEKLVIKYYERLGGLEVMKESLKGDLMKLERGDCVVTFSRKDIFALKQEIEEKTGKKCAVIYGSLPPETRSIQAQLFNDPDSEYEILVASDAVGMGLNLSVKRIVFETTRKYNGKEKVTISIPAVKQIAGRAGRFRVANLKTKPTAASPSDVITPPPAAPAPGLVTTLDDQDLGHIKYAMSVTPKPLRTAGILPSALHVERYAALFPPETPLANILGSLKEYSQLTKGLFHLCSINGPMTVARALKTVKGLSVSERLLFCMAPIANDGSVQETALEMAQKVAGSEDGSVLKLKSLDLDILDIDNPTEGVELKRLETLHKSLLLYLWLSWRFPATFSPRETAQELKALCESLIDLGLKNIRKERNRLLHEDQEEILASIGDAATELGNGGGIEDVEEERESVIPRTKIDEDFEHAKEKDLGFVPNEWVGMDQGRNHEKVEITP